MTLIELIVVMVLIAILLAIGVPSYRSFTTDNRMAAEMDALQGDLDYARAEAVREGRSVTVCVADSAASTSCAPAGTNTWQNGWLVFTDIPSNQVYDASSGDTLLHTSKAFTQGDTFDSSNGVNAITFNRDGFTYLNAAANGGQVAIILRDQAQNSGFTRCLYLSQSGMITTTMHVRQASCI